MDLPRSSQLVIAASTVLAVSYFVFFWSDPLVKIFPIIALVLFLYMDTSTITTNRALKSGVIYALIFSSVGDVLLEINFNMLDADPEGAKPYFLGGLAAFLVAHIVYIRVFSADTTKIHPSLKLLLFCFYGGMMYTLLPNVKQELLVPILVYGAAIAFMGATMIARYHVPEIHPQSKFLAVMGALFFMLSDSILAVNKFVYPVPNGKGIVLATYYIA